METVNLKSIMNHVKANAEWFALRKVYESDTYRIIRDGNPQANSKNVSNRLATLFILGLPLAGENFCTLFCGNIAFSHNFLFTIKYSTSIFSIG